MEYTLPTGVEAVAEPDNVPESDADAKTLSEFKQRYEHLRRVTKKTSQPYLRPLSAFGNFEEVYADCSNIYSREQLLRLEKCFLMADHNKDGKLSIMELKYWLEKHNHPVSPKDLKPILQKMDLDHDGEVDFREFLKFCQSIGLTEATTVDHGGPDPGNGTQSVFDCFDEYEGDGGEFARVQIRKQSNSYHELGGTAAVNHNVEYFENRVKEILAGPKPQGDEAYLERVREIMPDPNSFDYEAFSRTIRHPLKEAPDNTCEVGKAQNDNKQNKYQTETKEGYFGNAKKPPETFRTEMFVDLMQNKTENDHSVVIKDDLDPTVTEEIDANVTTDQSISQMTPDVPVSPAVEGSTLEAPQRSDVTSEGINTDTDKPLSKSVDNPPKTSKKIQPADPDEQETKELKFIDPDLQEDFEQLTLNSPPKSDSGMLFN